MNCNLILGIDWLCKHNPAIDWESNVLQFACCGMVHSNLRCGDNQPMYFVVPIQKGNTYPILEFPTSGFDNSIDIAMLLEDKFFNQGQITAFGLIDFIPNSINIAVSMSNITSDNSVPIKPSTRSNLRFW